MQVNELQDNKSSSKRASAARTHNSDATAGFPSANSKTKQSSSATNKAVGSGGDAAPSKQKATTSGFENQDRDSEDAESFDEEKQKN